MFGPDTIPVVPYDDTDNPIHLFIDWETGGLRIKRDVAIEVAWCFTNSAFQMLTPLRQRYTRFYPENPQGFDGIDFDPCDPEHWQEPRFFDSEVPRMMHLDSGLASELAKVSGFVLLDHPRDFLREVYRDFAILEERGYGKRKVVLSGAGISHFDNRLMDHHWPEAFPLAPGRFHHMAYYYHDTSVAWRMLGNAMLDPVIEWSQEDDAPADLLACEAGVDASSTTLTYRINRATSGEHAPGRLSREWLTPHRAADDVVASLLDARVIRHIGQNSNVMLTSRSELG